MTLAGIPNQTENKSELAGQLLKLCQLGSWLGVDSKTVERSPGTMVGIEVKAGATLRPRDFRGLERLREAAGERFVCGIVLHDGEHVQRAGSGLFGMPVSMLWDA